MTSRLTAADRLGKMLVAMVCKVTGGPCEYPGRSMKATHTKMGVTEGEFNATPR